MNTNPGKAAPPLAAIAIVIALSLGACSNPSSSSEDEEVSLSGVLCFGEQEDGSPCYWDGSTTAVPLGTIGLARNNFVASIARSGSSAVAAGYYYNSQTYDYEPRQWEGSEAYALPVGAEATGGSASRVAADGGAVYAAGYVATADGHFPALWKNRELEAFDLPAGMVGGEHTALAAQDGSLYRAGRYWDEEDVSSLFAVKDGGAEVKLALPDGSDGGYVKDIAVSGSAVRYVGYYFLETGSVPCLWDESGARTDLSLPPGLTRAWVSAAVFVGDELYIGGYGTNENVATVARVSLRSFDYCYWKNGAPEILEAPAGSSSESRLVDAQNAHGQAAFIGQISDSEGDSYYCAWVGGVPRVIARAYPQKG
ncbi:MAG TPA: hypothetical protein PLB91_06055 [Spirochaetales bacterium]|nr:hypothetical protein [Spirochaetales bacterium]HRY53771.1 hypothetical protein [Spirochaetia bacterium]HRZ65953.1 hypothetical protein [Spirochaetia bacterium]